MNGSQNLIHLEQLRSQLMERIFSCSSNSLKIYLFYNYFETVLSLNSSMVEEAFLSEFLDDYLACISSFEVWGVKPEISYKIIKQVEKILSVDVSSRVSKIIKTELDRIREQSDRLSSVLQGKAPEGSKIYKVLFPLIDREAPEGFYGISESITARINKAALSDKFIIIPSEKEIEKNIQEQCRNSWSTALKLAKEYIRKPYSYHEVIISFDKREGFYEGNSLGIALTLCLFEQLLNFYNPAYIIKINEESTFTGGVSPDGKVYCTGENIIRRKIAAVFFSEIETFVIPKEDEPYAQSAFSELKGNFPGRKLKLIPVEDIYDVLNRRDLVDLRKQKIIIRSRKFVQKNWISAATVLFLTFLLSFFIAVDLDDNPTLLSINGNKLFIKNRNEKILWIKSVSKGTPDAEYCSKIVDIEGDGENEVIIWNETDGISEYTADPSVLKCYNKSGELLWRFSFADKVTSLRENLNTEYGIMVLDTVTINGQKKVFLCSSNGDSFSSAIYSLDLKTGRRLPGTFWGSGHIVDGLVKDYDYDNKEEMIGLGIDNGFEDAVLFVYEIDDSNKVRPTTEEYLIRNYPPAKMEAYIRFPKTDYDKYFNWRTPGLNKSFVHDKRTRANYNFTTSLPGVPVEGEIGYHINYNFKDIDAVIISGFRVKRDSLVAQGKLISNIRSTDSEEYIKEITSNILYWKEGKWVKKAQL